MIVFILHWQLFMLKRQYRYFQNWFPLIVSILVQTMFIFSAFFGGNSTFQENLGVSVLYILVFSIPQVFYGYRSMQLSTTQGIIGISPLPPSAKSAWVLLMLSINSLIVTVFVSLVLGVLMAVRVSVLGGLVLFPVAFIFFFGVPFGLSALIEGMVKGFQPKNPQKVISSIGGLLMMVGFLALGIVIRKDHVLLNLIGQPILDIGKLNQLAVPFVGAAIFFGLGGYALRVLLTLNTREHLAPVRVKSGNKSYKSKSAPTGLIRLFYWVEVIFYQRKSFEFVSYLVLLFFLTYFQRQMWMWGIAMVGGILGSVQLLSLTGPKGLPLLFVAPVSLWKVWYSRLVATLPLFFVFWLLAVLLAKFSMGHLLAIEVLTSFMVAFASLMSNSLVQIIFRQAYINANTADQQKKRRTVSSTIISILTNELIPIGLSGLSYRFELLGLSLSSLIILAALFIGYHLLHRSKRPRYLWGN